MKLSAATLCDFAQVREGLLFVSSGGVSQLVGQSFPSPINVVLALSFVVDVTTDTGRHSVRIGVADGDGEEVGRTLGGEIGWDSSGPSGRAAIAHMVLGLAGLELPEPGAHSIRIRVDDKLAAELPLYGSLPDGVQEAEESSPTSGEQPPNE